MLIGLLGLALAGLCWRRFKATAVRELPALAHNGNGFVPASAVHPGQEQGNGTDRPSQPGRDPSPGRRARRAERPGARAPAAAAARPIANGEAT